MHSVSDLCPASALIHPFLYARTDPGEADSLDILSGARYISNIPHWVAVRRVKDGYEIEARRKGPGEGMSDDPPVDDEPSARLL